MPATAVDQTHFLGQTYPNPSNGTTVIDYFLPDHLAGSTIDIFDISGKLISTIKCSIGNARVEIDVQNWPSGIYYYSLNHFGMKLDSKKFVVIE